MNNKIPTLFEITEFARKKFKLSNELRSDIENIPGLDINIELLNICHYEYKIEYNVKISFPEFYIQMTEDYMFAEGMDEEYIDKYISKLELKK